VIKPNKRASPEKQRKTKTKQGLRGYCTGPSKIMDLRTRMANYFAVVCVKSEELHLFYFEAPAAPGAFGIRSDDSLSGCGGRAVQSKSAGREANAACLCTLHRPGCPVFACVSARPRATAVKKQENGPLKKNKENVLYRPALTRERTSAIYYLRSLTIYTP
jgi:hypothetical protein